MAVGRVMKKWKKRGGNAPRGDKEIDAARCAKLSCTVYSVCTQ